MHSHRGGLPGGQRLFGLGFQCVFRELLVVHEILGQQLHLRGAAAVLAQQRGDRGVRYFPAGRAVRLRGSVGEGGGGCLSVDRGGGSDLSGLE